LDLLIVQAHVTSLVTSDENPSILRVPYDEVREKFLIWILLVPWSLSAPGPDGFVGKFYRHYWDIVSQDVVLVV